MNFIFLTFIQVYCQLQLNPVSGQSFYYKIQDVLNTSGYTLQVLSPNLGFQIQGGFVSGGLNSTIQTQNVISTSFYQQMNLIGLLEYSSDYSVSTTAFNLSGCLSDQTYLFNVSSANQTCQTFEIIGYVNILQHCTNTSNSQVTIYFYNNSQLFQFSTGFSIANITQLSSTNIQYYYEDGIYDLYFIYICQFQSSVLNSQLFNNTLTQLKQIWSQPAQYLQIFVSFEQEVFALQFNYLLYQYDNYREKFLSQNGSNWISMNILYDEQDEFLIYLVNNYTIYEIYFEYSFQIFSQQQLPVVVQSAQIYSDMDYLFILTSIQTLVYQYEGDSFQFYQYSQYSIMNQLNQYSSLSNIIVHTNSSGIQLFQLLDYFLYNNQPSQSGFLTIGMFNQDNQMTQNYTIYINVLTSYQNQICPTQLNFNGTSYQSKNSYYQQVDLSQFYIGSNLTYSINQTSLNGISILNQQNYQNSNETIFFVGLYSISQLNAVLSVQVLVDFIVFQILQYAEQSQDFQSILVSQFKLGITCQDIYFLEYDNGTIMTFVASFNYIYAFQFEPTFGLLQNYIINLNEAVNHTQIHILQCVLFNNLFIILNTDYQVITLEIFTSYYIILNVIASNYSYIIGYQYEQYFLFAVNFTSFSCFVDIYAWVQDQFQLFQTLQLSFIPNNVYGVYIHPVLDGIFVCYDKSFIKFYEKATFIESNIAQQQFYNQIDTTNITFIIQTQSDCFLYVFVKYNNNYYVNIYQGTQNLNSLYQSIYIDCTKDIDETLISASSDIIKECDYLVITLSSNQPFIYQIPHKVSFQQFPNFKFISQFNIINTINVSNLNYSFQFQVNFTIFQQNIEIGQIQNLTQITNNQTNGIILMNPYQYFTGVIQSYDVTCSQCQNLSLNNIISNNYFFYQNPTQWSASYIKDGVQYIYNLNAGYMFLCYYNMSNYLSSRDVTQNTTLIAGFPQQSDPLLLFLEFQTNSITWLLNINQTLYIYTLINGTQSNMTIPGYNSSNIAQYAVYNDGVLQIISYQNYSCYYYQIDNQTMLLVPIIVGVFVNALADQEAYGSLFVYFNEDNYIFGMFYLDIYSTLQFIILDLTIDDEGFKLNDYLKFPLEEIVSFQKDFPFQYVQQYVSPFQENNTSFIYLAYTTTLDSGILELEFLGFNLIKFQKVCSIFILNSTFNNNYLNVLSLYDNQIAIMNFQQNDQNSNLTLQLYLIDLDQCQSVQPYSFQILGTFNNSVDQLGFSLNYLYSNQLLLSLNGFTYVIEVNQFLEITYQTQINSTIILTAQNPFFSQNQQISINFSPDIIPNNSNNTDNKNKSSHQLQWYWIMLITLSSLVIIGGIFLLLYYRLKKEDESNYQSFSGRNEIEIKDQKGNISGL